MESAARFLIEQRRKTKTSVKFKTAMKLKAFACCFSRVSSIISRKIDWKTGLIVKRIHYLWALDFRSITS